MWCHAEARTVNRFVAKHQEMLAARGPAAPERSWGTSVARVVEQLPGAAPDGPAAFAAVPSAPAQPLRDERSQNGAQSPIAELAAKEAEVRSRDQAHLLLELSGLHCPQQCCQKGCIK